MVRRRWLLFALSIASLIVLTYASVLIAFSVPVTDAMRDANGDALPSGGRAVVLPLAQARLVTTHTQNGDGALLVFGARGGNFPASTQDPSIARALAFVHASSPASIVVADVPTPNGTANLTIDLAALGVQGEGFVVKGDGEEAPRFVPTDRVVGRVDHIEGSGSLGLLFVSGALGFVTPLIALIATHRGAGRKGAPDHLCRACSAPLPGDATFCTRCGEYRAKESA